MNHLFKYFFFAGLFVSFQSLACTETPDDQVDLMAALNWHQPAPQAETPAPTTTQPVQAAEPVTDDEALACIVCLERIGLAGEFCEHLLCKICQANKQLKGRCPSVDCLKPRTLIAASTDPKFQANHINSMAFRGDVDGLENTLIGFEITNASLADDDGLSPLHWAVLGNQLQAVTKLLEIGANKEATDRQRRTPRAIAEARGYSDIAALL